VRARPITASKGAPLVTGAKPRSVPPPVTRIPAFARPTTAMKIPIPRATAFFKTSGILSIIFSLTFNTDKIMKRIPSTKTA
jgi:hypothetical protein